jgi:hypothetical protein
MLSDQQGAGAKTPVSSFTVAIDADNRKITVTSGDFNLGEKGVTLEGDAGEMVVEHVNAILVVATAVKHGLSPKEVTRAITSLMVRDFLKGKK